MTDPMTFLATRSPTTGIHPDDLTEWDRRPAGCAVYAPPAPIHTARVRVLPLGWGHAVTPRPRVGR